MTKRVRGRGGFTLIEILVVLTLAVLLMGMTAMISTWALDRDRAEKSVNQLSASAGIARSRAMRDGLPYGIRLLPNGGPVATTYQFIQSPPVLNFASPSNPNTYLQFEYPLDPTDGPTKGRIPGTAAPNNERHCLIYGLSAEQIGQITVNSTLYLPTLGTWHQITAVNAAASPPYPAGTLSLTLDTYPDFSLGAATHIRVYEFGMYGPARAVLGEEVMQLPQYSCVDLSPGRSVPELGGAPYYDILWAPSGRLVTVPPPSPNTGAYGHVFLWVCNPDKRGQPFEDAGEQLLCVIKSQSGGFGGAPVDWNPADHYALGRKALAGN
jgi:prepilin-type N-terminal cleavage/methylation domain-containing protein